MRLCKGKYRSVIGGIVIFSNRLESVLSRSSALLLSMQSCRLATGERKKYKRTTGEERKNAAERFVLLRFNIPEKIEKENCPFIMNHRRCYTSLELATPPSKVCRAIRWETNSSDFSVRHLNAFPIWLEIALPRRSYFPMAGIQWEVKTFRKSSPYIRPRVPGERLVYFVSSLSVVRGTSKLRVPAV